ncbi:uncharacterized protein LOC114591959 [Podarcis muralis]
MLCADPSSEQNFLSLAGGKSNQTCPGVNYSAALRAVCPAGWIVYGGKCYFFSEEERNWASAQSFCISQGSSLAKIQNELEKVFMLRFKGEADHWIGLRKDFNDTWIWADRSEYSNTLVVKGSENCAYLSKEFAIASRCHIPIKWICSHPDAYVRNKNSTAGTSETTWDSTCYSKLLGSLFTEIKLPFDMRQFVICNKFSDSSRTGKIKASIYAQKYSASCFPSLPLEDAPNCKICPNDWELHRNTCYWISQVIRTWTESQDDCKGKNSTLLVIQDQQEMAIIKNLTKETSYWLGLKTARLSEEWTWEWVDGSPFNGEL